MIPREVGGMVGVLMRAGVVCAAAMVLAVRQQRVSARLDALGGRLDGEQKRLDGQEGRLRDHEERLEMEHLNVVAFANLLGGQLWPQVRKAQARQDTLDFRVSKLGVVSEVIEKAERRRSDPCRRDRFELVLGGLELPPPAF
jgi:hypothetical protein